jgi:hypothetical protein
MHTAEPTNGAHIAMMGVLPAHVVVEAVTGATHTLDRVLTGLQALRTIEKIRICNPAEDYAMELASAAEFVTKSVRDLVCEAIAGLNDLESRTNGGEPVTED